MVGLSPETPRAPLASPVPPNTSLPPPRCCSFVLFLDLLLPLALFYLFLVRIIPGFPQCFGFPP